MSMLSSVHYQYTLNISSFLYGKSEKNISGFQEILERYISSIMLANVIIFSMAK